MFEVRNPFAANPAGAGVRWLSRIPAVSHEGIRFDSDGNLYFIDEDNSGSIYRYVPTVKGDLGNGQTFVLKVTAFTGNASLAYNAGVNLNSIRTGPATWVPITDVNGNALTKTDPFAYVNVTGGRLAADEVGGTPYGRPEDILISNFTGRDILYFPATSEPITYSVTLGNSPVVKIFVSRNTTDLATGLPVGTAYASPDNVAMDTNGHVYIVEDQPAPVADIWQAVDNDGDGVAESVARWFTLGVTGAEPTGLMFNPNDSRRAFVNVQHPDSGNDALWELSCPTTPVTPPVLPPVVAPVVPSAPAAAPVAPLAPATAPVAPSAPTVPVRPPVVAPVAPVVAPVAPVVAPVAAPVKAPTKSPVKAPTKAPTRKKCGLLKLNLICLNGCGLFGRLFKFCKK
jgi:secreted PhoX family phosphatase